MTESLHISSLLVTARPDARNSVAARINALPGTEVAHCDDSGKIIVALETPSEAEIVERTGAIQSLPGVANASLVFHQIVDQETET